MSNQNILTSKRIVNEFFDKYAEIYGVLWKSSFKNSDGLEDYKNIVLKKITIWAEHLSVFMPLVVVAAFQHSLKQIQKYPPTLFEIEQLCLKFEGVPTVDDVIDFAIQQDFVHPVIKLLYDKVGSWDFKHLSSKELKTKVEVHYADQLMYFRTNQTACWQALNTYLERQQNPKLVDQSTKSPSKAEYYLDEIRLKLGMPAKYVEAAEAERMDNEIKTSKDHQGKTIGQIHSEMYTKMRSERVDEFRKVLSDLKGSNNANESHNRTANPNTGYNIYKFRRDDHFKSSDER